MSQVCSCAPLPKSHFLMRLFLFRHLPVFSSSSCIFLFAAEMSGRTQFDVLININYNVWSISDIHTKAFSATLAFSTNPNFFGFCNIPTFYGRLSICFVSLKVSLFLTLLHWPATCIFFGGVLFGEDFILKFPLVEKKNKN